MPANAARRLTSRTGAPAPAARLTAAAIWSSDGGATYRATNRLRSGGSMDRPGNGGTERARATTRKRGCTGTKPSAASAAAAAAASGPALASSAAHRDGDTKKRPSSSAISRFSSRLFSSGMTLRSARSMPSSSSRRPATAARTGAPSTNCDAPPCSSRICLMSASVVSREMVTPSTSRPTSSAYVSTRRRRAGPGSPTSHMSCPSASFCNSHRRCPSVTASGAPKASSCTRGTTPSCAGPNSGPNASAACVRYPAGTRLPSAAPSRSTVRPPITTVVAPGGVVPRCVVATAAGVVLSAPPPCAPRSGCAPPRHRSLASCTGSRDAGAPAATRATSADAIALCFC